MDPRKSMTVDEYAEYRRINGIDRGTPVTTIILQLIALALFVIVVVVLLI